MQVADPVQPRTGTVVKHLVIIVTAVIIVNGAHLVADCPDELPSGG